MQHERFGENVVFPSIPAMYQARMREHAGVALTLKKEKGTWRAYTGQDAAKTVRRWTYGLMAVGVKKGDRVGILSQTRMEWSNADLAIQHLGAVTVGVYPSLLADDVAYQLEHSETKVLFVEDAAQLAKVLSVRARLPLLETVIVFDHKGAELKDPFSFSLDDLDGRGSVEEKLHPDSFEVAWKAVTKDDLATIIYTSGTTGPPKGALLTHGNICFVLAAATSVIPTKGPEDMGIGFLPLAHALQRVGSYLAIYNGVRGAYAESIEKLMDNMRELRPTVQVSVPRIWEKIHARIQAGLVTAPWHRRALFKWALAAGRASAPYRKLGQPVPGLLGFRWSLAQKFWRGVVLPRLGLERIRFLTSGGAPISLELLEFFYAMDLLVLEGWGLTETAAPATFNTLTEFRFGTVGKPIPSVTVKLAEDGELLVKGPGCFQGYYKDEAATRDAFDPDGFFRTGDIGTIDAEGFIRITDRKKNLIVTSGGKKIAPQNLENIFKESAFLGPCLIHGDRRNFLTAIFSLDRDEIVPWARERGIKDDLPALADHDAVKKLVADVVEGTNKRLPSYEQVKRFSVTGDTWTVENGLMTPTLKIKRKNLEERYRSLLESFYEGEKT
jgi:long-chain acyl-CoA synthetase